MAQQLCFRNLGWYDSQRSLNNKIQGKIPPGHSPVVRSAEQVSQAEKF